MMDERMWASALDTLCQLLSDLVRTIKICKLFVQLVQKQNFANSLVHKMQIATHCGVSTKSAILRQGPTNKYETEV